MDSLCFAVAGSGVACVVVWVVTTPEAHAEVTVVVTVGMLSKFTKFWRRCAKKKEEKKMNLRVNFLNQLMSFARAHCNTQQNGVNSYRLQQDLLVNPRAQYKFMGDTRKHKEGVFRVFFSFFSPLPSLLDRQTRDPTFS